MKIAVLGATGKTGRYLVARLCEHGHAITAIDRSEVRLARLDPQAARVVWSDCVEVPATSFDRHICFLQLVEYLAVARFDSELGAWLWHPTAPPNCQGATNIMRPG